MDSASRTQKRERERKGKERDRRECGEGVGASWGSESYGVSFAGYARK